MARSALETLSDSPISRSSTSNRGSERSSSSSGSTFNQHSQGSRSEIAWRKQVKA